MRTWCTQCFSFILFECICIPLHNKYYCVYLLPSSLRKQFIISKHCDTFRKMSDVCSNEEFLEPHSYCELYLWPFTYANSIIYVKTINVWRFFFRIFVWIVFKFKLNFHMFLLFFLSIPGKCPTKSIYWEKTHYS